jgi:hypothetical protein
MWKYFNNNPANRVVGDCSVRAVSAALNLSWDDAFDLLAHNAKAMCDMPSSDAVWGSVLRQHGFVRSIIPSSCPDCYTIGEFAQDFARGIYVLGTGQHVATVIDGVIYDSWDSSREIPSFMWRRV